MTMPYAHGTPRLIAIHSWEIGTRQTALLELQAPNSFLYRSSQIPPQPQVSDDFDDVWVSVQAVLAQKPPGQHPFFNDGSAGDPCSKWRYIARCLLHSCIWWLLFLQA